MACAGVCAFVVVGVAPNRCPGLSSSTNVDVCVTQVFLTSVPTFENTLAACCAGAIVYEQFVH